MRLGRVVKVYPSGNAVDVLMLDDATRYPTVKVMSMDAASDCGAGGLPEIGLPDDDTRWDIAKKPPREVIAVVATINGRPIVIGFLHPSVSEVLFEDKDRYVRRTPSDVYTSVDGNGNLEVYHPSGTFIRIGENPAHEDLTGKDFNGVWAIDKNTTRQPNMRLQVANSGGVRATLTIAPNGNVTLVNTGNLVIDTDGTLSMHSDGNMSITTGGTLSMQSTGNMTLNSSAQFTAQSATAMSLISSTSLALSAPTIGMSGTTTSLSSTGNMTLTVSGTLNATATAYNWN